MLCDWQRDGTLSAGRSAYVNYCGILQQFVQSYISKQKVRNPFSFSTHYGHCRVTVHIRKSVHWNATVHTWGSWSVLLLSRHSSGVSWGHLLLFCSATVLGWAPTLSCSAVLGCAPTLFCSATVLGRAPKLSYSAVLGWAPTTTVLFCYCPGMCSDYDCPGLSYYCQDCARQYQFMARHPRTVVAQAMVVAGDPRMKIVHLRPVAGQYSKTAAAHPRTVAGHSIVQENAYPCTLSDYGLRNVF